MHLANWNQLCDKAHVATAYADVQLSKCHVSNSQLQIGPAIRSKLQEAQMGCLHVAHKISLSLS